MGYSLATLCLGILLQVPAPDAADREVREAVEKRASILSVEAEALTQLADSEAKAGRDELSRTIKTLIDPPPPSGATFFRILKPVVTAEDRELATKTTLPKDVQAIRQGSASDLFALGRKGAAPPLKCFALADACLRDVLQRDPDHAEARRLLGFVAYEGGWATADAKHLLDADKVLHPVFGWVDKTWVEHLDRGELPSAFNGRGPTAWLPAAEVDALHSDWESAWKIDTAPHFQIRSNVPLAESIAFARHLEELYEVFQSEFADVIGAENLPLARRFAAPGLQPSITAKKFEVWYFSSKQEYMDFFQTQFNKKEDESLGYYMPPQEAKRFKVPPRSYFYKDDKYPIAALATLFHEGSHQLLFESAGKANIDPKKPNYWIWEGLGTYFETMTPQPDGTIFMGQLIGPRIADAQARMRKGEFVPIKKLVSMDEKEFLDPTNGAVYRNYPESMALAVFLLNGEGGRYRLEFLDYVADSYRGKGRGRSLEDRLDTTYRDLDARFLNFLK